MNFPFIEHTTVGIGLSKEHLHWVEIKKTFGKISLINHGRFDHDNSVESIQFSLEKLKESIKADVFKVCFSSVEILNEVKSIDIPYFEEEGEVENWISEVISDTQQKYSEDTIILHDLIELDEDLKRLVVQVVDSTKVSELENILNSCDLSPSWVYTGITETGYSSIFDTEFLDKPISVLAVRANRSYLNIYENGLLRNIYSLEVPKGADLDYITYQASSILQSESVQYEDRINQLDLLVSGVGINKSIEQESFIKVHTPLKGLKKENSIDSQYATVAGAVVKSFFQDLDSFDFVTKQTNHKALQHHDKKELIKTSVLLFSPLFLILLLGFGFRSYIEYQLQETNQIMNQIGDKLEAVSDKRELVSEDFEEFLVVKDLVNKRKNSAKVFEFINTTLSRSIDLQEIKYSTLEDSEVVVIISGRATTDRALSTYMSSIEKGKGIVKTELLNTEKTSVSDSENETQTYSDFQLRIHLELND